MEERKRVSLEKTWNTFAKLLNQTKKAWEEHQRAWGETSARERESLPIGFQRFVAQNFNRSKFDIMLPRLVDFYRAYGGIEMLVVEETKEKKREERK